MAARSVNRVSASRKLTVTEREPSAGFSHARRILLNSHRLEARVAPDLPYFLIDTSSTFWVVGRILGALVILVLVIYLLSDENF